MKKYILLLFLVCSFSQAQFIKLDMVDYSTVFDTLKRQPVYSVYTYNYRETFGKYFRTSITANPLFSSKKQPNRLDYLKNTLYDRGHLAPVLDFTYSSDAQKRINVYTNVAPQHKFLNRGIWRDLESYTNLIASTSTTPVQIFTGVDYGYRKIGRVQVPLFWYKLVIQDTRFRAWLIPNKIPQYNNFSYYEVDPQIVIDKIDFYGFKEFSR